MYYGAYPLEVRVTQVIDDVLSMMDVVNLREGLGWYEEANAFAAALCKFFDIDTIEQAIGIVAALSQRTRWEVNKRRATEYVDLGEVQSTILSLTHDKCEQIMALNYQAGWTWDTVLSILSGPKLRDFAECIYDPWECRAVVIDTIMCQLFGVHPGSLHYRYGHARTIYQRIGDVVRARADEMGWMPHQLQAVLWEWFRRKLRGKLSPYMQLELLSQGTVEERITA